MDELKLFSDGSVHAQSKIGYGAYLAVSNLGLALESLRAQVKVRRFAETSSTKLELQTILWALREAASLDHKLTVYTDSQNIIELPGRRERYEQSDYRAKNNKRLNNYELYRDYFSMIDLLDCTFVKVSGHRTATKKNALDRIFTLVDRAARNALRQSTTK